MYLKGNWVYGVTKSDVFIVLYKHYFPNTVESLLQTLALDLTRQGFPVIRLCIVHHWRGTLVTVVSIRNESRLLTIMIQFFTS